MASNQFTHPFKDFQKKFRQYRQRLPDKISTMAVEEMKLNFRIGGSRGDAGNEFWAKRKVRTWNKRKTNDTNRALLIKSGRLRRGLKKRPDFNYARVINDVPYASVHRDGFKGVVIQKVKSFVRKMKSGKKSRAVVVRSFTRRIKQNIPQRDFMAVGQPFMNVVERDVLNDIDRMFTNS